MLVLPITIPLGTAILGLLSLRHQRLHRAINVFGSVALLIASVALFRAVWQDGILATSLGNWPAPFGITFVVDHLSAMMVVITAVTGLAVTIYALGSISPDRQRGGFYALLNVLLVGVNGSFVTGDLFNLYVWFEVMLIASFALLVLGGEKRQLRGGIQYVLINLVSSASLLIAIALTYGLTGSLNMADVAVRLGDVERTGLVTAVGMLFMVAFGIKAALFPLFFWLPVSYYTAPPAVGAVFAGLLTKVGVYALVRTFTLLFVHDVGYTHQILLVVAGLTMLTGVLGAAIQYDIRKILGFHIISQIGYMVMGLALFTRLALIGAVFYIAHHIIVKANLFLLGGVIERTAGSFDLNKIGGLYRSRPWLAMLFLIPAFSLAGFPPLSGFWAKMIVIKASLDAGNYAIAGVALVVSALTIFSMTKIWALGFWKRHPEGDEAIAENASVGLMVAPIAALAVLTVLIGLLPESVYQLADRAAGELLDRSAYLSAVLGEQP
jgi:multicomponent Na+:H+ antiporter subunit D